MLSSNRKQAHLPSIFCHRPVFRRTISENNAKKYHFLHRIAVAQQTEMELESNLEENSSLDSAMDTSPLKSFHPSLGISQMPRDQTKQRPIFMRKLGGTEAMYNFYLSRGTEVLSMMSRIESVYPVPESTVRLALQSLMARHPLLRSSIRYDKSADNRPAMFVENPALELDFLAVERSDWLNVILEEVHNKFNDDDKPLWRCRMVNATKVKIGCTVSDEAFKSLNQVQRHAILSENMVDTDRYDHQSIFIFIAHHSIIDGGYILWLFQDFVNFLDAYIMQTPIGAVRELPLLPPIEDCVKYPPLAQCDLFNDCSEGTDCRVKMCYDTVNTSAIADYAMQFRDEITTLSKNQARNEILYFKYSKQTTTALMSACARENCKPPGVFLAAIILAMVDLIYPECCGKDEFEIPFDFMLDLRRHYQIESFSKELIPNYTGVATSHIPMSVRLELSQRPASRDKFLRIANALGTALQCFTIKPDALIIDKMKSENEIFIRNSAQELNKKAGKSPFILCFSNIGRVDNLLHDSLRERIRLTDVHGHSSTLVDQMPIFFVTALTVNGSLSCNISYCNSYTSPSTALCYMDHLRKYLDQMVVQTAL